MVPSTYISPSTLVEVHAFLQGGRRYFSRREITALVGGPGNMAVYRHKLVIPPTAKVLSPKNENRLPPKHYRRIALPLKKYRRILVLPLPPEKYRQLSIPPKEYCQLSRPPERYRQHWIPPKRYRRHWISPKVPPILDAAEKVPRTLDTAQRVPAFVFAFVLCSLVLSGSWSSFSVEPLCGREDREAPRHLFIHLPPHLPTPRSAWSAEQ